MEEYSKLFSGKTGKKKDIHANAAGLAHDRREHQAAAGGLPAMVNNFYDLVTDFYEYGGARASTSRRGGRASRSSRASSARSTTSAAGSGSSPARRRSTSAAASAARCATWRSSRARRSRASRSTSTRSRSRTSAEDFADVSAGTQAEALSVSCDDPSLVPSRYCEQTGLADISHVTRGDFQNLPGHKDGKLWEGIDYEGKNWTNKFDAAYAIEATCHSPDKKRCFSEVARCLKKGGLFAGYEWCVLPDRGYDKKDPKHVAIKEGIEVGNGLPTLAWPEEVVEALEAAASRSSTTTTRTRACTTPRRSRGTTRSTGTRSPRAARSRARLARASA